MKICKTLVNDSKLGDIEYKKKFAFLPIETRKYKILLESYVEVWIYRYNWIQLDTGRLRKMMWVKEFNLSETELIDYYDNEEYDKLKQEVINGEVSPKCM